MWTVYVLLTYARNPVIVYVGKTSRSVMARVQEHIDGTGAMITRQFGVKKLIHSQEVRTAMQAEELEHLWAHDLPFILEPEMAHVSNGINRYAIKGRLFTTGEETTALRDVGLKPFDYDHLPPRDLFYQRKIWRERFINPIRVFATQIEARDVVKSLIRPIPTKNQISLIFAG